MKKKILYIEELKWRPLYKCLIMVKTCLLLLLFCINQVRSEIRAQQININGNNISLRDVFKEIKKQSGLTVICKVELLESNGSMHVKVNNKPLAKALELILEPISLTYTIEGKSIVVRKEAQAKSIIESDNVNSLISMQGVVRGYVTDQNGKVLAGVSVTVQSSGKQAATDESGRFTITAQKGDRLLLSYLGYARREVLIADRNELNIQLLQEDDTLDEVVVVGYGTQRKSNLSGAVEMVDSKKLKNRPLGNLGQALQGVSPGLNVFTNNSGGQPDATMNFNIRGMGSPLVLVDGLPVDINLVNPEDIENISVIKDASSAAIYGANAPYGVILITTKKGNVDGGRAKLNYNNTLSMSAPTVIPNTSNSLEFATYMNDATVNAGSSPLFTDDVLDRIRQFMKDPNSIPAVGPDPLDPSKWAKRENANGNTNWYKELLKPWAFRQKHDLNFLGGTENFDYYVSTGSFDHNGQLRYANEGYKRYNIDAKLGARVTDWMRVNFLTKFSNSNVDYPNDGYGLDRSVMWHDFSRRFPTDPVQYPNGTWSEMSRFQVFEDGGREKHLTNDFWTKMELELRPLAGWEVKGDFGWNNKNVTSSLHRAKVDAIGPDGTNYTHFDTTPLNSLTKTYARNKYWNANVYSSYEKKINDHQFKILIGHQREFGSSDNLSGYRDDLLTDYIPSISLSTGTMRILDQISEWSTMGTFARLNYNFADKYLVEFNGRYQGSSRFEQGSRFGFFPSISAAYRLSQEQYWIPLKEVINDFKLRFSYGSLGNHNVANFLYLPIMPVKSQVSWLNNNEPLIGVSAPGIVSSYLTWETIQSSNLGFDASFWNNRLTLTMDLFRRDINDMIGTPNPLPTTLGTSVPQENNAAQRNAGWEMSLSYKGRIQEDFNYQVTLGLTDYKTVITKWNNPNKVLSQHYVGKRLGEIWGYESNGLFQSVEEINSSASQTRFHGVWTPGDVRYEDLDGNGAINPGLNTLDNHGDLRILGNSNPRYIYSLNLAANYRSFDMTMFWTGVGKQEASLSDFVFWGNGGHVWGTAVFKEHLDYYTAENTDAYWPKSYMSSETDKNRQTSSRYLQDASYLRLRNVSFGYTIPESISKRFAVSRLRAFVNGENLFSFSKVQNFLDPEGLGGSFGSGKVYPIQKTISFGLNVQF